VSGRRLNDDEVPFQIDADRFIIGRPSDFPAGSTQIVEVRGHSIGVFNVGGVLYALLNRCPHQGGPLCLGTVWSGLESTEPGSFVRRPDAPVVECPWHSWEFDLQTGQSYCDPRSTRVRTYPVTTEAQKRERHEGPYRAQTIPVEVEDDVVVIRFAWVMRARYRSAVAGWQKVPVRFTARVRRG
jgi:nitrite reductase/ring-hydroxylating ferredoxin subunit